MPQAIQFGGVVVPIRTKAKGSEPDFVPVCFSRMPDEALSGLPLYMRSVDKSGAERFTLYAGEGMKFTSEHRSRLEQLGVSFIHILTEDQPKLRRQLEERIETLADDHAMELAVRCEIIYESSIELIDEMLTTRNLKESAKRVRRVARSIIALYEESAAAFTHFFAAARHDASASTHAANAAVWLPALARELGETKKEALVTLCVGAMVYDIGMTHMPQAVVNRRGKLTVAERQQIEQHPELGAQLLRQVRDLEAVVATMALQHQERLDGSGYPRQLRFDQIHQVSRMVAVIDTFDALTSFRPYRDQGISPAEAMGELREETPHHYDPKVVGAWQKLLSEAYPEMMEEKADRRKGATDSGPGRRRFPRFATHCQATVRKLALVSGIWTETESLKMVAHNLSRGGLGLLSRSAVNPGDYFRAKLHAKDGVARALTGIIVRVRVREDGLYDAGMRFVDLAQEAIAVTAKGDAMPGKSGAEDVEGDFVAPQGG